MRNPEKSHLTIVERDPHEEPAATSWCPGMYGKEWPQVIFRDDVKTAAQLVAEQAAAQTAPSAEPKTEIPAS